MFDFRIPSLRFLVGLAMLLALSSVAYGFAASNTLDEASTGENASGYTIDNVHYTLNASAPTKIDSVSLDVISRAGDPTPRTVKAKLVNASSSWFDCTATSGKSWSCAVTGVTTAQADKLSIVAAE